MNNFEFDTHWLKNVIPIANSVPANCHRYERIDINASISNVYTRINSDEDICPREQFNRSRVIRCDQDGLFYRTNKISIVQEVCRTERTIHK